MLALVLSSVNLLAFDLKQNNRRFVLPMGGNWKAPYAAERVKFVCAFYDYAHANPNGRLLLWSEWLKSNTP